MTAYSDNDRVEVVKGSRTGKKGTITSLNVKVDGEVGVRVLDFASVKPLVVVPPPPPPPPATGYPVRTDPTARITRDYRASKTTGQPVVGQRFGSFNDVQLAADYNNYQNPAAGSLKVVTDPADPNHKMYEAWTKPPGIRCEFKDWVDGTVKNGDPEVTFTDRIIIPSDPNKASGWADSDHNFFQFHADPEGSAEWSLQKRVWGDQSKNGLWFLNECGLPTLFLLHEDEMYDKPLEYEFQIKVANDNSGHVRFYWQRKLVYEKLNVPTMSPQDQTMYWGCGHYGETVPGTKGNRVLFDGAVRTDKRLLLP